MEGFGKLFETRVTVGNIISSTKERKGIAPASLNFAQTVSRINTRGRLVVRSRAERPEDAIQEAWNQRLPFQLIVPVDVTSRAPGQPFMVTVQFSNPSGAGINFTPATCSGSINN